MKAPPNRLSCDSLSAHSEQARFLQAEAGNRVQSDNCYGLTLVLMGRSHGETEPRKVTNRASKGITYKPLTPLELKPAAFQLYSDMNLGFLTVKMATPKRTINRLRERRKTSQRSRDSRISSR